MEIVASGGWIPPSGAEWPIRPMEPGDRPGMIRTEGNVTWICNGLFWEGSSRGSRQDSICKRDLPIGRQYVGGIRLVRGWVPGSRTNFLRSINCTYEWKPGVNTADRIPASRKPHGFYGFLAWDDALRELGAGYVLGTIICWGRVVRHETGMRTEFAKVESLVNRSEIELGMSEYYSAPTLSLEDSKRLATGLIPLREDMV